MDEVSLFYEKWDWELADIDDEDILFWQLDDEGNYATITNMEGLMPETLDSPIIFSVYDHMDSFQWSVTLDDSHAFADCMRQYASIEELLKGLQHLREDKIEEYMRGE